MIVTLETDPGDRVACTEDDEVTDVVVDELTDLTIT